MRGLRIAIAAALVVLVVATVLIVYVVMAPGGGVGVAREPLAADQTLSFPIAQDIADLDPALVSTPADVDILRNVFSGLYRFDETIKLVPDIAVGTPDVSADGLTYTFHLRQGARFSNRDPITADDFIYSWNRAAARQGEYASLFGLVAGYDQVAIGRASAMTGLAKVDALTFTTKLTKRAGYWPALVGLWPFWVVDKKVITAAGEDTWFTRPETLVGSGPFRMSAWVRGQSLDFEPVATWYGGKTGAITHVHIEVLPDLDAQVARFESGVYTVIGYARQALSPAVAVRYTSDAKLAGRLQLVPAGLTYWVGFNFKTGPFAGLEPGRAGRHAFSAAVDRAVLAAAVCSGGTTCAPATGGLISKGLQGYLGDGADASAKFDAVAAKAEYTAWDPSGAKANGLKYVYDTNPFNKAVCTNLVAQWKQNLGVTVACTEVDRKTYFDRRNVCTYAAFRQSWSADYDHPQNWFDYLFTTGASSSGSCYSNPSVDKLVASADARPLALSAADYKTAGHTLVDNVAYGALLYGVQQYLVQPYVKGAGGNALYDFDWTLTKVLRH